MSSIRRLVRPKCQRCDVPIARPGFCYICANQRRREVSREEAAERMRVLQAARAERSRKRQARIEASAAGKPGRPRDAEEAAKAGQMVRLPGGEILTSMHAVHDPELVRRKLFCRRQGACLEEAMKRRWDGLSCDACPVNDTMSRDEHRSDMVGLAELLKARAAVPWRAGS